MMETMKRPVEVEKLDISELFTRALHHARAHDQEEQLRCLLMNYAEGRICTIGPPVEEVPFEEIGVALECFTMQYFDNTSEYSDVASLGVLWSVWWLSAPRDDERDRMLRRFAQEILDESARHTGLAKVTPEQITKGLATLLAQMEQCLGDEIIEPRRSAYLGVEWALVRMVADVRDVDLERQKALHNEIYGASRRLHHFVRRDDEPSEQF